MSGSREVQGRSGAGWAVLLIVLAIEAFGGLVLVAQTALGMLQSAGEPLGARLSIFLAILLGWIWICAALFGGVRGRASWARGSALTIHVLLFAVATGVLQLNLAGALFGWGLVLLALIGFFAALIARPNLELGDETAQP